MTAHSLGAWCTGGLAAASLAWPGGRGPAGLLPPERLATVVPAVWVACCLLLAGRPGAWRGVLLAAPALAAAGMLSSGGAGELPGLAAVAAAGAWWWHAAPDPVAEPRAAGHALLVALACVAAPSLGGAVWASVGLDAHEASAAWSPAGGRPGVSAAVPLALAATGAWAWRRSWAA